MENLANVTTGEVRLSYVHLFKPYAAMQGQEEKFSVTVLVPKADVDTMNRINAAIEAAKQRGISDKWNGQCPPVVPTPVHDGDGVKPSDGCRSGRSAKATGCSRPAPRWIIRLRWWTARGIRSSTSLKYTAGCMAA